MCNNLTSILCLLLLALILTTASSDDTKTQTTVDPTFTIDVEHGFGNERSFTKRSTLKVYNIEGMPPKVESVNNIIKDGDLEGFKQILQNNELYKIRMRSDPRDSSSLYVQAAIPACKLQETGFKEDITLQLSDSGRIVGIIYTSPAIHGIGRTCDSKKVPSPLQLKTKVKIADKVVAQTVPLQAVGPRPAHLSRVDLGASVDGSDPAAKAKSQSFIMQYWYIVLPIAIIALMGGGEEPPKKEGASSSGAAPTAAK